MLLTAFGKALWPPGWLPGKTGRVMKLTTLFLLAGFLQLSAKTSAQGITFSLNNAALSTAFTEIQRQTPYRFIYATEQLEGSSKITLSVQNSPLDKVLELCFRDQPVTYTIEDNFIIIKVKEKKVVAAPADNEVKGRVTNEKDEPIAGASVRIKGSQRGTASNNKGEFIMADVAPGTVIIFSSIGFEQREIIVGNNRYLDVHLQTLVSGLDEMVVKGYYSTTKRLNTGSVSIVTAEEIGKQPVNNPLAALEGRMSGVYITQSTGVPGSAYKIQIRGQNSLRNSVTNNGNLPLYIVDGVPYPATSLDSRFAGGGIIQFGSPLSSINPNDIESIEVLKDADATAIYGSRGANGVILITTKKGKIGNTALEVNLYSGIGKITRPLHLLNTQEYLQMRHEAFNNDSTAPTLSTAPDILDWDTTRYTDWQKKLIGGISHLTNAQMSISGGNKMLQFLLAANYSRETTVYPGDFADQKLAIHLSLNHSSINEKFRLALTSSYVNDVNRVLNTDLTSISHTLPPDAPAIYDSSGNLNWQNSSWTNPFSYLLKKYINKTNNLISNLLVSYQLPHSLQLKASFGFNSLTLNELQTSPLAAFDPAYGLTGGAAYYGNSQVTTYVIEPQLDFQKMVGKGKLSALAGITFQQSILQGQTLSGTGFSNDALLENIQAASSVTVRASNYSQYKYNAVYARINYNLKDKYLLNLTGRRDGSSRFDPSRQFANFGAVGAAWIFSNESVVKNKLSWLSFGKLRASYGITGNDQIPDYGYLDTYSSTSYGYNGNPGLIPTRLISPGFSWETNKKLETALETSMLNNRIYASVSWYHNRSSNQLVGYNLPPTTGFSSVQANLSATVQNSGWEFQLSTLIFQTHGFQWNSGLNATIPKNRLISFPNIAGSSYANTYIVGKSLYVRNTYQYKGVDPATGLYIFNDVDKDGDISYPNDILPLKKVAVQLYGGWQNSFKYKNFQFDFLFQFVKQTGFDYTQSFDEPGDISNQPTAVLARWQHAGDVTNIKRFSFLGSDDYTNYSNGINSDLGIKDASFVRLKNLSLSFELPVSIKDKLKASQIKIYLLGQNLLTITGYKGADPESLSNQLLPPLKVLTLGIKMTIK